MPLETGTYISDLVASNPAHTDSLNNADAHMRLIKSVLQATFPGVNAAVTKTVGSAFQYTAPDGSISAPAFAFASEPTLGFYRKASGVIGLAGGRFDGLPVGGLHKFFQPPPGFGSGGVSGGNYAYLELDGSTYQNSEYPALAAHLAQGGTTFTLPNAKGVGAFFRSRTASTPSGTYQPNEYAIHAHTVVGTSGPNNADHQHAFSGTTGVSNQSLSHNHPFTSTLTPAGIAGNGQSGGEPNRLVAPMTAAVGASDLPAHNHSFSGVTGGITAPHAHSINLVTSFEGSTETRPENFSVIVCIKT